MSSQPGFSGAPLPQPPLDDDGIDLNNNDPNNNIEYNEAEPEVPERNNVEDVQITLLNEARSIHTILNHYTIEEIYSFLEASIDHPNRVTVVTDMFLARDVQHERGEKRPPKASVASSPPASKSQKSSEDLNNTVIIDSDDDDFLESDFEGDRNNFIDLTDSDSNNSAPSPKAQQNHEPVIPIITFTEASQEGENETVKNNLMTLSEMFPSIDKNVLKDMYMQIYPIEGERTLDVLVMQMLDMQDGGQVDGPVPNNVGAVPVIAQNVATATSHTNVAADSSHTNVGPTPVIKLNNLNVEPRETTVDDGPSASKKAKLSPAATSSQAETAVSTVGATSSEAASTAGATSSQAASTASAPPAAVPGPSHGSQPTAGPSSVPTKEPVAGPSNVGPSDELEEQDSNGETEQLSKEVQTQLTYLLGVLPDADPTFLKHKCTELKDKPEEMRAFIMDALEKHEYPTLEQYNKNKEAEDIMKKFTGRLSVKEFLKSFPDPENHFKSKTNSDAEYQARCVTYLKSRFRFTSLTAIKKVIQQTKNLTLSVERLTSGDESAVTYKLKKARSTWDCRETNSLPERPYLPFIQEVFFIDNKENIKEHFQQQREAEERQKVHKQIEFEQAKSRGELLTCGCCFDEECLFTDMSTCPEGHLFCKDCIRRYAENEIGDGRTKFKCLESGCELEFTLAVLQEVLATTAFSRLLQKKQSEEVAAANIEGLENCPFCDFSLIPPPDDKIFRCLNPDCLKHSCRECKEPAHIPLRCDEVEKDEEVKARKFVEDRMTEALVRECWQCHKKFVKIDGCNKMTCTCGAKMCYLCRQPIKDYDHFNNSKCQLHTNNDEVHIRNVRDEAERALQELKAKNPEVKLKHDPTKDLPPVPPETAQGGMAQRVQMMHVIEQRARAMHRHMQRHMQRHGQPHEMEEFAQALAQQRRQIVENQRQMRRFELARMERRDIELQHRQYQLQQFRERMNIPAFRVPAPPAPIPPAHVHYGGGFNVQNFQPPLQLGLPPQQQQQQHQPLIRAPRLHIEQPQVQAPPQRNPQPPNQNPFYQYRNPQL